MRQFLRPLAILSVVLVAGAAAATGTVVAFSTGTAPASPEREAAAPGEPTSVGDARIEARLLGSLPVQGVGTTVTMSLPAGGGRLVLTGGAGSVQLRRAGGGLVGSADVSAGDRLVVQGPSVPTTLVVDFGRGNPIPDGGLTYVRDAGDAGDALVLRGGAFDSITHTLTGANAGSFLLDPDGTGARSPTVISYGGVEVLDRTRALDRTVTFAKRTESIERSLVGRPDGSVRIDSTLGPPVTFPAPTGSLFVDAGSPLTVGGVLSTGGGVAFRASSPLTIGANITMAGSFTFTAGETDDDPVCADDLTINAGVTVQSTGGSVTLQAGDEIINNGTVQAATTITEVAGFNDLDGCGEIVHNTNLIAPTIQLTGLEDVCIDTINQPSSTVMATSTGGDILDCNDPPAGTLNVTANILGLSADDGVGVDGGGGALETQVVFLEAQTNVTGIDIAETDSVRVGGVSASLKGLHVVTSGAVMLVTGGGISLMDTDGPETVKAGDNLGAVDLIANGAASTITSIVNHDSVTAPAGPIQLNAGQDIQLGTGGANFDNDVRASSAILLQAGRDIVVDGAADVVSDDFINNTGGDLTANAGRDVKVVNTNGVDASMAAAGNGGANLVVMATSALVLSAPVEDALFSNTGHVVATANTASISAASGITAAAGNVTLNLGDGGSLNGGELHADDALTVNIDTPNSDVGTGDSLTISGPLDAASAFVNGNSDGDTFTITADPGIPFKLNGRAGVDTVDGGPGDELILGGPGGDTINSDAGEDVINAGDGIDIANGEGDNDIVRGGRDGDALTGGPGVDTLRGGPGDDGLNTADGTPNDLADGDLGTDTCTTDLNDRVRECEA